MEYRDLGRTGEKVSVLSFGTSPLGGLFGPIDEKEGIRTVHMAIEQGINFIDTAPYYGNAETILGKALSGRRDQILLGTKVGRYEDGFDFSKQRTIQSIERSLALLHTDYVDILQAHDIEYVEMEQVFDETYEALTTLHRQGKCRFIGMTGFPLKALCRAVETCDLDVALNYCHYTLVDTTMEEQLIPLASARGVGLINAAAVCLGLLTPQGPGPSHQGSVDLKHACRRAHGYCEAHGADISVLAVQFCLAHPTLATTVIGTSKTEKLKLNLVALETPIDEQLLAGVQEILAPVKNKSWARGLPENN